MNKTAIEWCDYTVNPVKGLCPVACPYCYARRMYKRLKWDETIRLDLKTLLDIRKVPKGSRVFIGSTMELFGPWVRDEWISEIIRYCGSWPDITFIFLTKRPWELPKFNPWPDNCWVGMSATNHSQIGDIPIMGDVQAKVRFVSFEPLLDYTPPDLRWVQWVIIGQQTPVKDDIPAWWIADIENEAFVRRVPVFHKDNLRILPGVRRREFPC
jgi:protein gp37